MQRITVIGDFVEKEDPESKVVAPIPNFSLELANRLPEEKAIDLQFSLGQHEYDAMMKRELGFGTSEEATVAKNMLLEIKRLDELDQEYVVLNSPFTNTMIISINGGESQYFKFPNIQSYNFMIDVLKWINHQEQYV